MHVANGMYGLILVEPPEGLPTVDREYYVMQGDFYTTGSYREKGLQPFDMEKAIDERPTYVVFNGAEGALTGDKALTANAGRDACASSSATAAPTSCRASTSSARSSTRSRSRAASRFQENVQTTLIPAGGAAMWTSTSRCRAATSSSTTAFSAPSTRARSAILKADGEPNLAIYSGKEVDEMYLGDRAQPNLAAVSKAAAAAKSGELTLQQQVEAGKALFAGTCSTCHQPDGAGLQGVFPPLARSDYIATRPEACPGRHPARLDRQGDRQRPRVRFRDAADDAAHGR